MVNYYVLNFQTTLNLEKSEKRVTSAESGLNRVRPRQNPSRISLVTFEAANFKPIKQCERVTRVLDP